MTRKIIDPRRPPILWDTVKDAIEDINANFEELYTNGGGGTANVDLSAVAQNIVPDTTETRDLGTVEIAFPNGSIQTGAAISLADLKTLVAASTDFADFQTRIAAL